MTILASLPLVHCELSFSDGLDDISSFQAGAARANWTNNQITIAVMDAKHKSDNFNDVGEVLYQYCTDDSWV